MSGTAWMLSYPSMGQFRSVTEISGDFGYNIPLNHTFGFSLERLTSGAAHIRPGPSAAAPGENSEVIKVRKGVIMQDKWLDWAIRLQSIAQSGLFYSKDKYDLERFQQIRDLSAEIICEHTDLCADKVIDLFCCEKGYQTPKIDVRAVIIENNQILMVREQIDGKWSLPGGWAEVDLSLSENIRKEVKEEAGLEVSVHRLIAVLDARKRNPEPAPYGIYKIMVECKRISGAFAANIETSACSFFPLDDLPELSKGRITREQIELCFQAARDEDFVPFFD